MTQKEEIWQRALTYSDTNPEDYVRGAQWMYEKMMKSAVEGTIEEPESLWWRIMSDDLEGEFVVKNNFHDGDRVKMIIIKSE